MLTIHKFTLNITDHQRFAISGLVRVLSVQTQRDVPVMWAMVNTEDPTARTVHVWTIGTGHPFTDVGDFLGTYQVGGFVGHVFVEVPGG